MPRVLSLVAAALVAWCALAGAAWAQEFPALTGRVVDAADLLDPATEQQLTDRLAALETQSGRQLVVATVPDLGGYPIEDYGYQLGREWGIGDAERNDGALLIVAPNDRKVRVEVGYGLEGILTDALSSVIIRRDILPRFRDGDYAGGIVAGVDRIANQLVLPADQARERAAAAQQQVAQSGEEGGGSFLLGFWAIVFIVMVLSSMFSKGGGRRYRGGAGSVLIWGSALGHAMGSGSRGGFGGGGFGGGGFGGGGFGGGGFSGGGGSFGGGGASGGW